MPNQDLDEDVVQKAPEGYFFPGYFAFVLCGPFGDKDHESVLLGLEGNKKEKGGRASLRKEEAEVELNLSMAYESLLLIFKIFIIIH